jgi:hypothetical protein
VVGVRGARAPHLDWRLETTAEPEDGAEDGTSFSVVLLFASSETEMSRLLAEPKSEIESSDLNKVNQHNQDWRH